jgi:hypothetical protein
MDSFTASESDIKVATLVSYNVTTQNNSHRNEKIIQDISGDPWYCPVQPMGQRILHHRKHNAKYAMVLAYCFLGTRRALINVGMGIPFCNLYSLVFCLNIKKKKRFL